MKKIIIYSFIAINICMGIANAVTIPQQRPSDKPLEMPGEIEPDEVFLLPPPLLDSDDFSSSLNINVKAIELSGNKAISSDELLSIVDAYTNRMLDQHLLNQLRNKITWYYVEKGYLNSGAYYPDQDLADGVLKISIIEGKITELDISIEGDLTEAYVRQLLSINTDRIFNMNEIKNRLYILQQYSNIAKVDANLLPTELKGKAKLILRVTEDDPLHFSALLNNYRPPSVGEYQGVFQLDHLNLTGQGDQGYLLTSVTEGLRNIDGQYRYPLVPGKYDLGVFASTNDSEVVEDVLNLVDIENESSLWGVSARYVPYKTLYSELNLSLSMEFKSSETRIDGSPFLSVSGTVDPEVRASIVRFSQEWLHRDRTSVMTMRSMFSVGLDRNNATIVNGPVDAKYAAWLGQLQWRNKTYKNQSIELRSMIQLSNDPLLPFEQIAAGGRYTARGYRENALIRDNGLIANLEYYVPFKINKSIYPLNVVLFTDYAQLKNRERTSGDSKSISSAGLGMVGQIDKHWSYEMFWAHANNDLQSTTDDALQDDGVHLQFRLNY
ncbi:MAG: BamA/TamA family outer membrane protein [Gammaproteobacteria bacterium]|nr:BamA/TamA family outer membrane protein [Gammaproteobacteria bacterium]